MNTKKDLNKVQANTTASNPLWETFDAVIAAEKFDKIKIGGFEVINFSSTKNYQQKRIDIHYEVLFPVEKGKWGISKDYDISYNADNINLLKPNIKALKNEMKTQKFIRPGMKKDECREEPFRSAGWYIYYKS